MAHQNRCAACSRMSELASSGTIESGAPVAGIADRKKPMLCASKNDNTLPAIWSTAKLAIAKPGHIKGLLPSIAGRTELTERQAAREGFRCPEYRLRVECLF